MNQKTETTKKKETVTKTETKHVHVRSSNKEWTVHTQWAEYSKNSKEITKNKEEKQCNKIRVIIVLLATNHMEKHFSFFLVVLLPKDLSFCEIFAIFFSLLLHFARR